MSEIKVNNGNIEDALKRFKRQCARNGVLQEVRKERKNQKQQEKESLINTYIIGGIFILPIFIF